MARRAWLVERTRRPHAGRGGLAAREHVERIVDEPREVPDLALDLAGTARLRAQWIRVLEDEERVADRRERVAELVREDAEELALAAVGDG